MGDSNFWNETPKIRVCWKFGSTSAMTEKTSLLIRRALLWIRGWDDWVRKRPSPEIAHSQSSQCPPASDSETCFSLWMEDCDAGDVDGTCACVCLCVCVWQVFIQTQASLLCKLSICKIKTLQKPPIFQTLFSGKSDPKKKSKVDCRINSNICYVPSKILNTVSWRT